jgi:D-alanyl-D-alanine carboxypeptidase/D-alanyl-D-alanine-endopeptidase (penicillin-binding protein 4)
MVRLPLRATLLIATCLLWAPPEFAQIQSAPCSESVSSAAGTTAPCTQLAQTISAILSDPAVTRDHWGVAVIGMDGVPIYSLNEAQLFQPASNAKLFTTAAAVALLGGQTVYQTKVMARGTLINGKLDGDLVLVGVGDANLSGRVLPYVPPPLLQIPAVPPIPPLRYLEDMADQVAASGVKVVSGNIIGDDTFFPWEPYAEDWTMDDAVWGYGAPVSALSVNDNQIELTITPGIAAGAPATVTLDPAAPYYTLVSSATTGAKRSGNTIGIERAPGSKTLRVYGAIAAGAQPEVDDIAIEDPAEYAAIALKGMLEARGITITGKAQPRHRILLDTEDFKHEASEPLEAAGAAGQPSSPQQIIEPPEDAAFSVAASSGQEKTLATHTSPPLLQDVVLTNKVSQNLHAELLLRQLGAARGRDGTIAQGARVVRQFLLAAGIDGHDFIFFDGSGLSGHDLVTPRATARLLQYASGQPWFAGWKTSLPVAGVDGSLERRFSKPPLKGNVFAKTGTLGEARALSGYVVCASGRTVIFSIMVGNHLPQTHTDRDAMDRIVGAIAEAN